MAEGHMIKGYKVHESPVPGEFNKFVLTEDQAWFLAMEDKNQLHFFEILTELLELGEDLEGVDAHKFEDGRILVGYVDKETREVSIHNWYSAGEMVDSEVVKRRVRETFPHAEYFEAGDRERYKL